MNIIPLKDSEGISITNPFHLAKERLSLQNDANKENRTFLCISQSGHGVFNKWLITQNFTSLYNTDYPLSNDTTYQALPTSSLGTIYIVESTKNKKEVGLSLINMEDIIAGKKNYLQHSKVYLLALLNSNIHILHLNHKPSVEAVHSLNYLLQVIHKIYGNIASSKMPSFILLIHGITKLKIKGKKCESIEYLYDYISRNKIDHSILSSIKIIEIVAFPITQAQTQNEIIMKDSKKNCQFEGSNDDFVSSLGNIDGDTDLTKNDSCQIKIDKMIKFILKNAKTQSLSTDKYYNNLNNSINQIDQYNIPKLKLKVSFDQVITELIPLSNSKDPFQVSQREVLLKNKLDIKIMIIR